MNFSWARRRRTTTRALYVWVNYRWGTAPQDTDRDALNGDGWWRGIAWPSIGWMITGLWLGMIVAVAVMRLDR